MKKKIVLLSVASFLVMGTVSAASLWGNYKGNPIVKINVDGKTTKYTGTPAITYNNKVMLPIETLKQLGVKYTYDSKKLTANITKPQEPEPVDVDAVRAAPISWLQLYFTVANDYKNMNDFSKNLNNTWSYVTRGFENILGNMDAKYIQSTFDTSNRYLESLKKDLSEIENRNKSTYDWGTDNDLDLDEMNKIYDKLESALDNLVQAQSSLESYYRLNRNQKSADDYFYYLDKMNKENGEAFDMIYTEYEKYYQLIQNFK